MDAIQERLQPLIDFLPDKVRDYWWAIYGFAALLIALMVLALLRGLFRSVFGKGKAHQEDWAKKLREDLTTYPPPPGEPGKQRLTVYHVPVRLRLVVLAPAGKETVISPLRSVRAHSTRGRWASSSSSTPGSGCAGSSAPPEIPNRAVGCHSRRRSLHVRTRPPPVPRPSPAARR